MAGHQSLKSPPVLDDEGNYADWKQDLVIWQMYTDIEKRKQGPAVYLCLSGKARECARDIKSDELGAVDGVSKILTKLDSLFEKDKDTRTFLAFNEFYDYRRASGDNIVDFLVHFEHLYSKLKKFEVELPVGVQAFFLLKAANLSDENERLARATCGEMNYANMKKSLMNIFGDPASGAGDNGAPSVKSEPVFQSGHEDVNYTSGYRNWRGRGRGKGRGFIAGNGPRQDRSNSGTNPLDRDGRIMKCYGCGSVSHLSRSCPTRKSGGSDGKPQDIHITLFNAKPDGHMTSLVKECLGKALLDSACTKTVCGATWLNLYLEAEIIHEN